MSSKFSIVIVIVSRRDSGAFCFACVCVCMCLLKALLTKQNTFFRFIENPRMKNPHTHTLQQKRFKQKLSRLLHFACWRLYFVSSSSLFFPALLLIRKITRRTQILWSDSVDIRNLRRDNFTRMSFLVHSLLSITWQYKPHVRPHRAAKTFSIRWFFAFSTLVASVATNLLF